MAMLMPVTMLVLVLAGLRGAMLVPRRPSLSQHHCGQRPQEEQHQNDSQRSHRSRLSKLQSASNRNRTIQTRP